MRDTNGNGNGKQPEQTAVVKCLRCRKAKTFYVTQIVVTAFICRKCLEKK